MGDNNSRGESRLCLYALLRELKTNYLTVLKASGTTEDKGNLLFSPPPKFGHPMLDLFGFAPGYVELNSGEYQSVRISLTSPKSHRAISHARGCKVRLVLPQSTYWRSAQHAVTRSKHVRISSCDSHTSLNSARQESD